MRGVGRIFGSLSKGIEHPEHGVHKARGKAAIDRAIAML
jgi:hypothetical protein